MRGRRVGPSLIIAALGLMMMACWAGAMDIYAPERRLDKSLGRGPAIQVGVEQLEGNFADEQRKLEALEKLKEALGIRGDVQEETLSETPPQFMVELYNTVTDGQGYTTGRNPFDAKVVRSFVERGVEEPSSQLFVFNLAGLRNNESILEAELHLYRKRPSAATVHPSVLYSPYYITRIYQVMPNKSLDEPDLHRLLNVHYVGAYTAGWQVFNVKQAVLSWLSEDSPSLGLLVAATTIFGEPVGLEFVRREEEPQGKQPILVLFNDDGSAAKDEPREEEAAGPRQEPPADARRHKRHNRPPGQPELPPEYTETGRPAHFRRDKKHRSAERRRKAHDIVAKQRSLEQTLSSMDIYERAMLRERLQARKHEPAAERPKREAQQQQQQQPGPTDCRVPEPEPCARRDLYVNFRDIGMTTIIAPEGYAAHQCRGHCKSPLSQDQKPTNHATIQGIIHKMNLAPGQGVQMPCCVPVSLSSISILYHDDERDGVVLKSYTDMAVVSCGCR